MSEDQLTILLQIKSVFYQSDESISLDMLSNIDNMIYNMQNDDKKIFLWASVAIARSSIQYWTSANGKLWIDKFKSLNANKSMLDNSGINKGILATDINWNAVAYADFADFCRTVKANSGKIVLDAVRGAILVD